jgi:hypothetical protein
VNYGKHASMNEDTIYQWKIIRKDSGLGEILAKVLSNPFKAISRANLIDLVLSILVLVFAVIIAAAVGWLSVVGVSLLLFYILGSVVGHQVAFVVALVTFIILFCTLFVLLSLLLYARLMVGMMEVEFSKLENEIANMVQDQATVDKYNELLAARTKCRLQLITVKKQLKAFGLKSHVRYILVYFLWLVPYLLSSPASPLLQGFSGPTNSSVQWHYWFADTFFNSLLFDLPNVLFGSFSAIEPSTWYARVTVFFYKILLVSSMIFFLTGALRQYWRKTEVFTGTEVELNDYLENAGRFQDKGNFSAEREWQLVAIPKKIS